MTTTLRRTQGNNGAGPKPANAAAQPRDSRAAYARRLRVRRGAGAVLVLVAALWGHQRDVAARDRQPVLVAARSIAAGQPLSEADVAIAQVALGPSVAHLPSSARGRVIGRVAMVDLRPGQLLVGDWLASAAAGREENVLLPLPLKAGRYPPGLRPGDHVLVVVTSGDTVATTRTEPDDSGLPASVAAVDSDKGGFGVAETVVTILIPKTQLARLAAAGGQGRVLLAASVR